MRPGECGTHSVGLILTLTYHSTRISGRSYRGLEEEKPWLTSLIVLVGGG